MLLGGRGKGRKDSRTIHIHLGPHKTGSTAIQRDLRAHGAAIAKASGIRPIDDPCIWELGRALNKRQDDEATRLVEDVSALCAKQRGDVLISCEDLAGELPGRTNDRKIYPRLWPAVNLLRKAFAQDRVRFYFFTRDPEPWLRSSYVQLLKYRDRFKSFEGYTAFLKGLEGLWDDVIERPVARLGEDFVTIPYQEGAGFSATVSLLTAVGGEAAAAALPPPAERPNSSPPEPIIRLLEQANGCGSSRGALQAAKESIWKGTVHVPPIASIGGRPEWPPRRMRPEWLSSELEALWTRVNWRGSAQDQPNVMPPTDCDLISLRTNPVEAADELPDVGRENIENQVKILEVRFRRQPRTCLLLGLVISYLRRNTGHEDHASALFQRLWAEEYPVLLGFLETRWLISTFQTFLDHGVNENQRIIGGAGFFLANTMKLYEAERALDGAAPDAIYPNLQPTTKSGFHGLDRFRVGGSDLPLNTLAHLLELAAKEERAGRVLQEFLLRVKRYHSAFSRMDRTREAHDVDIPPFSDCWSFFEPPKGKG